MASKTKVKKRKQKRNPVRMKDGRKYTRPQSFEVKKKAVKLFLEEGLPADLVADEIGVAHATIFAWTRQYREQGDAGLKRKGYGHRRKNISPVIKKKITAVKKDNPTFGVRRISQVLRRAFFLPASPETVRKTLKEADLITPPKKKRRRKPPKVRRFERSRPNELWQSDITIFRVLERPAYLIGFMDDYSRYMVGSGLYRSQRAEYVLQVYETAVEQYGVPREMLTDNGRQYTNWRGKTRFEKRMKRDGVHHFRSAPHHPKTLGKIERFWKSLKDEFLSAASFETFEEAQERVAFWVKYYNHRRPHQGIDGACPAERFYKIHKRLGEVMDQKIEENIQELALHGKVKDPFYFVGRMGEKSVVIRGQNGEMMLEGVEEEKEQEVSDEEAKAEAEQSEEFKGSEDERNGVKEERPTGVQRPDEERSGVVGMERETEAAGGLQGVGDQLDDVEPVAGPGPDGDDDGTGAESAQGGRQGTGIGAEAGEASAEKTAAEGDGPLEGGAASDEDAGLEREGEGVNQSGMPSNGYALLETDKVPIVRAVLEEHVRRVAHESEDESEAGRGTSPEESGSNHPGAQPSDESIGGGSETGREPEDILQVGEEVFVGDAGGGQPEGSGTTGQGGGRREGAASAASDRSGETGAGAEAYSADPGSSAIRGPAGAGPASEETAREEEESEAREIGSEPGW